ncbi:hypothetical protein LS482_19725 [Sinomicrobium kalidii]|uniref:hypothetical protein n=1 Tax=Sinomicrobium kalidii TaxID=2900738 RepID=UPI001E5ECA9E|nr:hypothetical protein [Sinomicrobium kalidii]UGU15896.1 hypothetical protein LS482_19725 [Sinomicrobium kalidii]
MKFRRKQIQFVNMTKVLFTIGSFLMMLDVFGQTAGINTQNPTETLDVNGNVRVRDINANVGDGTIDRRVVADADGVLKTLDSDDYTFFHSRLTTDQTLSSDALANTILFDTPIATSPFYSYDNATGILTFNAPGLYHIMLQGGFTEFIAGNHLLLGILDNTTGLYIGRGSHWTAVDRSGGVGQIFNYITMINVPGAGFQIRCIAYASSSGNGVLLANESGASGSGNVTNITIHKTK